MWYRHSIEKETERIWKEANGYKIWKSKENAQCEHEEELGTNINALCFNLDKLNVPIFTSFQCSLSVVSNSLWPHWLQHARLPCPSPTSRACPNSCPSGRRCHPTISSSAILFSSCLPSFPASESFPMSQLFTSGGQTIGASASASVFSMNIQCWFPLGLTGLISLKSEGLLRVIPNTTVQKHQFFGAQLSLWSNSHTHTWLLENHSFD